MDFVYDSTLASSELRLLQPVSVTRDVLHFKSRRVQRSFKTPYTAVSYTWGNNDASEVIYLDNRRFRVRPNLWSCLYYLANAARSCRWDYLWVDAICINQSSDMERNSQVRLMDQTYRDATCVSVWLGLITFPDDIKSFIPSKMRGKTVEVYGFDWADSMVELSNRAYWSRVWVIQEFLLGRNVELFCSDNRINWVDFQEILCREIDIPQFYYANDGIPKVDQSRALTALPLVMGRHADKHPEFLQPLCDLLVDHHKSECKDPRDRVFALLGLVTSDERRFLNIYFPDYSISEDHVLIITLAHLTQFPASSRMEHRGEKISSDSEELFLGLGVRQKSQRRRLLRRADDIYYLGHTSSRTMLSCLASDDQVGEYGDEDIVVQQKIDEAERSRYTIKMWLVVLILSILLVRWS